MPVFFTGACWLSEPLNVRLRHRCDSGWILCSRSAMSHARSRIPTSLLILTLVLSLDGVATKKALFISDCIFSGMGGLDWLTTAGRCNVTAHSGRITRSGPSSRPKSSTEASPVPSAAAYAFHAADCIEGLGGLESLTTVCSKAFTPRLVRIETR